MQKSSVKIRTITITALFAAIATILMYFEIPLPFLPPFLKLDLSTVPVLIGSFLFGPLPAVFMAGIKALIHALSTQSAGVGELADFIMTSTFAVSAGLLYRRNKTAKGAAAGCAIGILAMTLVGALVNKYMLIPFYSNFMPIDAIVAACNAINPLIDSIDAYVLFGAVPFNIIKGTVISLITFAFYKRLSVLIKHEPAMSGHSAKDSV